MASSVGMDVGRKDLTRMCAINSPCRTDSEMRSAKCEGTRYSLRRCSRTWEKKNTDRNLYIISKALACFQKSVRGSKSSGLHQFTLSSLPTWLTRPSSPRNPTMATHNLYKYAPSGAAAMIFLIGFILGCGWHAFIIIRRRAWYFIPLIIGCLRTLSPPNYTTTENH